MYVTRLLPAITFLAGAVASAAAEGPSDPHELEAFLSHFFEGELAATHTPGAFVVVVRDGNILLSRGYGEADPVKHMALDAGRDRFYAGSVSKLFTATGVMQLCERGAVALDADVNRYLEAEPIEEEYGRPVTVEDLLTHRSGIEDIFVLSGRPRRVLPPGTIISYSNHGIDLAGEIIAAVSDEPFADYMERHVFTPLGMTRSSFRSQHGVPDAPVGWLYRGGAYVAQPWDLDRPIPSGSLSSSAADMGAFMIAHLQNGEYHGQRILKPETAESMRRRHASNHPHLPGVGLAFWEWERNGLHGVEHKGDTTGFESGLYLIPSAQVGLFVSYNTQTRESPDRLFRAFVDHYYPAPASTAEPAALSLPRAELERRVGSYRWTRCPKSTLGKLIAAGIESRVTLAPKGLHIEFVFIPIPPADYLPVEPLLFRAAGPEGERVAFGEDSSGRTTYMFTGPLAFEKLPWYETMATQTIFGLAFISTFLIVGLVIPIKALLRRRRSVAATGPTLTSLRWATWASAALNLVFLVGLTVVLMGMIRTQSFWGIPLSLELLLTLPLLTTPLAAALVFLNARAWSRHTCALGVRLAYGLYLSCAVAFIPYLLYWNLLGYNY
jgi:CubicO group peptidase (beta-lactamase class C family)